MNDTLSPGFAAPVADSQQCFRAIMDAMARPGRIARIGGVTPPSPLNIAAAATVLSLAGNETPLWLDPALNACRSWIAFHAGSVFCPLAQAVFALTAELPDLEALNAGTHEEPETSATVIVQVASLSAGKSWRLSGPGLREPVTLTVDGLPDDFAARWQRNRGQFPRGIDLVLCAGDALTALPRTVLVEDI